MTLDNNKLLLLTMNFHNNKEQLSKIKKIWSKLSEESKKDLIYMAAWHFRFDLIKFFKYKKRKPMVYYFIPK